MSEKIEPALTPEEWAALDNGFVRIGEGGLEYTYPNYSEDGWPEMWDGVSDAHGTAALALYGQPFGFTWAMRHALKAMWIKLDNEGWGDLATTAPDSPHRLAGDAIDRIAALLPPRK